MSAILTMRAAIVDQLRIALKKSVDDDGSWINPHPRARFHEADLHSALRNTPVALRVAYLGGPKDAELSSNEVDTPCAWAIYVVAKDDPGVDMTLRDELILETIELVLRVVASSPWDAEDDDEDEESEAESLSFGKAQMLRNAPLYEGEVDGFSAAVWSVTWVQMLSIPPAADPDIRPFRKLITKYDLAPKDGLIEAEDEINMPEAP